MSLRWRALAYLAYRALIAHPLKRLRAQGSGLERFSRYYCEEGLSPTSPAARALGEAASACVGCELCVSACELAAALPEVRALGLPAVFRLYGRSDVELGVVKDAFEACANCQGCDAICPTSIPVCHVVRGWLTGAVISRASCVK